MSALLFIGGSADGKRIEVEGFQYFEVPMPEPTEEFSIRLQTYRRESVRFQCSDVLQVYVDAEFMVLESMSTRDAFRRLLAHYHPGHSAFVEFARSEAVMNFLHSK